MWEWRAFLQRERAPSSFAGLDALLPLEGEPDDVRSDVYVLAERLDASRGLKLRRGAGLELKVLAGRDGEVERWSKPFVEDLEVRSHRTRELARLLAPTGPVPVRALRSLDDVLRLVRDLRLGEPRAVAVEKRVRAALHEGLRVERTLLRAAGRELESVAVEGTDPGAVRALAARLGAPPGATVASFPALLAGG